MDGRTVLMIVVVVRVCGGMNVECETLRLQSEQGKSREDREAPAHRPSVCNRTAHVKPGMRCYRPLTMGKTKTMENDHRLAPLGRPVAT